MDFFEQEAHAQRRTRWLVACFLLAVFLIVLLVYLVIAALVPLPGGRGLPPGLAALIGAGTNPDVAPTDNFGWLWNPQLLAWTFLGTGLVITVGSLWKIAELAGGGRVVAESLGGRLVNPATAQPDERRLLNVVAEMALASGIPAPIVYVLPREEGINAFAAGHSPKDAVVAVSAGALRLLSRDELQGVIGHEFSHILNGDMRLNIRVLGLLNGILCLAIAGRLMLQVGRPSSSRKGSGGLLLLLGLALLVLGYVGVFFGALIKAALNRQREFLADASSVQFTRNPDGLAGALKKIGGLLAGSRLQAANASEASHLFFANGLRESWFNLMATHPPLTERILAIDPHFDGVFPPIQLPQVGTEAAGDVAAIHQRIKQAETQRQQRFLATIGTAVATAGTPTRRHLAYAADLLQAVPPELQAATRQPMDALGLVFATLLSADPALQTQQLDAIGQALGPAVRAETERLAEPVRNVARHYWLPLLALCVPALRGLSTPQFDAFETVLDWLIKSDAQIELFEFALQRMLRRHLEPSFRPVKPPLVQFYSLEPLRSEVLVLLSALADVGTTDETARARAFQAGLRALGDEEPDATPLPLAQCSVDQLDATLERLNQVSAPLKRALLQACAEVVATDGRIESSEAEALRAIADSLDCPLPPFVEGV
ncbi:MAG: M48 family metallopeptidase [Verrucomicrobiota bacterium]|jgi:Zn-dependent protease with chaperone function